MSKMFVVHNTVRGRFNRTERAAAPEHGRLKQFIGGARVLRGRPVHLTEEKLLEHHEELLAKSRLGLVEVRTPEGVKLDLETLEPVVAKEVTAPLPKPPLDSAANDKPAGIPIPEHPRGKATVTDDPIKIPLDFIEEEADVDVETEEEPSDG